MDKSILLELTCVDREYDPFLAPEEDEAHLGITILRNVAQEISCTYHDGINQISVKI